MNPDERCDDPAHPDPANPDPGSSNNLAANSDPAAASRLWLFN
jgi:hypothetical protein